MSLRDKTNGRDGADESVWRPFQASLHSPPLSLMSDTLPLTRVSKSFAALSKNQTLIQMKRALYPWVLLFCEAQSKQITFSTFSKYLPPQSPTKSLPTQIVIIDEVGEEETPYLSCWAFTTFGGSLGEKIKLFVFYNSSFYFSFVVVCEHKNMVLARGASSLTFM